MSRYCHHCNKFVEPVEDRCPDCGNHWHRHHVSKYFVSGLGPRCEFYVNLDSGLILQDRFTIKKFLGNGSVGSVYLAHDIVRAEEVALKIAQLSPCGSDLAAQLLRQESRLHAKIADYQHVIKIHDIHVVPYGGGSLLILSMEYADGGTFRHWLLGHRDDPDRRRTEGLEFFKQASCGVAALHAGGITHLDLKPENLLLVDGILKVSDLGASRFTQIVQEVSGIGRQNEYGSHPGTPVYMSPEQFTAPHPDDIDSRSDIYSLGVILFEIMQTRCRPPFGGTYQQLRERHVHISAPPLEAVGSNVAQVVARCLEKKPQDRYETVRDLLDDLEGKVSDGCGPAPIDASAHQEKLGAPIDQLWEEACQCLSTSCLSEATQFCHQILHLDPGHEDAKNMLEHLQTRYQQAARFYQVIERDMGSQSLNQLTNLIKEAMAIYPDHPEGRLVQAQIASRASEYRSCMEEGLTAIRQGMWEAGWANFERAKKINIGGPAAARALEFIFRIRQEIETLRQHIDEAVHRQNRRRALFLARNLDNYVEQIINLVNKS